MGCATRGRGRGRTRRGWWRGCRSSDECCGWAPLRGSAGRSGRSCAAPRCGRRDCPAGPAGQGSRAHRTAWQMAPPLSGVAGEYSSRLGINRPRQGTLRRVSVPVGPRRTPKRGPGHPLHARPDVARASLIAEPRRLSGRAGSGGRPPRARWARWRVVRRIEAVCVSSSQRGRTSACRQRAIVHTVSESRWRRAPDSLVGGRSGDGARRTCDRRQESALRQAAARDRGHPRGLGDGACTSTGYCADLRRQSHRSEGVAHDPGDICHDADDGDYFAEIRLP